MKVRVLGCSGAIAHGCRTTSFLVNHNILIDAGTGVGDLTLDEMRGIDHVFLTHSHLDHIAALPLMLDAVASLRTSPVQVYALAATIEALQTCIFNNVVWPDFSAIPSVTAPFFQYRTITTGQIIAIDGAIVEVLPASHTVPAVGFALQGDSGWWVFSGDTGGENSAFWERVNHLTVAALVIETAFSNRETRLARSSQHLSPSSLARELKNLRPDYLPPIYITHTKPHETELIMGEIEQFERMENNGRAVPLDIRWLQVGQVFNV